MTLDQLFFLRPVPGYANYRTPVRGLYLCGAAAHPGGGVMGACGLQRGAGDVGRSTVRSESPRRAARREPAVTYSVVRSFTAG